MSTASPLSEKVRGQLQGGSWIRKMFEEGARLKARFGAENVYDFSLGNPIVEPPPFVKERLRAAVLEAPIGAHRYMPNVGYADVRAKVAANLSLEQGLTLTEGQVVMTAGAAGAMNVVLKAIMDPGDELLAFAPYFVEYGFYADNHGGVLKTVPTDATFLPDLEKLEELITARTRALIINSPNNPTGRLYPVSTLEGIGEVLRRAQARFGNQIYLLADEPYRRIVYDGQTIPPVMQYYDNVVLTNSHSKDLSMPGERIGFAAISPRCQGAGELFDALAFTNRILGFVNAPAIWQRVVGDIQGMAVDIKWYDVRRQALCAALQEAGFEFQRPDGAFYIFPRVPEGVSDIDLAMELKEERVLAVPGSGFRGPGHLRFCYAVDVATIEAAVPSLCKVMAKYR